MIRTYKLAANFNTVEFTLTDEDIIELVDEDVDFDEALKDILQREYDTLASIKVVHVAPDTKQAKTEDSPSEKQCVWAKNLGMKNPEKKTRKEVWEFIEQNKKK